MDEDLHRQAMDRVDDARLHELRGASESARVSLVSAVVLELT